MPFGKSATNKNNVVEQLSNIKELRFSKYGTMPPELRYHVLTFAARNTQRSYSGCARYCNSEIQRFNTSSPLSVDIFEDEDGIVVILTYKNGETIEKKFMFSDFLDPIEDAFQYFKKFSKYVKNQTQLIELNLKKWPSDIVKLRHLSKAGTWFLTINKSMYQDFIGFAQSTKIDKATLFITSCDKKEDQVVICPTFFRSMFVKSLIRLCIYTVFQMDREYFLNYCGRLEVQSFIDENLIQEKVRRTNGTNHYSKLIVDLTSGNSTNSYNVDVLFPRNQFQVDLDINLDSYYDRFTIGRWVRGKLSMDGKKLILRFLNKQIMDDEMDTFSDEGFGDDDDDEEEDD